jgi:hypothetical protein
MLTTILLLFHQIEPLPVAKPDYSEAKIVLAMVGLPARGKSYLSNKLTRYLEVFAHRCSPNPITTLFPVAGI